MGRLTWPLRPLPDGRGELWRWDLGQIAELPAARAGLRDHLDAIGFPRDPDDPAAYRQYKSYDEQASNALRHSFSPVVSTD